MTDSDKVLGVRITGNQKNRTWGGYRIDYDDLRDLAEIARETGALAEDETLIDLADIVIKQPPEGYEGHEAKSGYVRKVLTEYEGEDQSNNRIADVRDQITTILDDAGVTYETEDVYPPQTERDAANQWGADNGLKMREAAKWNRAVEDLNKGNISQAEFQRGKNPNQSEQFDPPANDNAGQ